MEADHNMAEPVMIFEELPSQCWYIKIAQQEHVSFWCFAKTNLSQIGQKESNWYSYSGTQKHSGSPLPPHLHKAFETVDVYKTMICFVCWIGYCEKQWSCWLP